MSRFITRVRLQNYKSIAACDVTLEPLTFLVGVNGAGKSNFLDALRFVTDALRNSLGYALRERGGLIGIRRRSGERPKDFTIRLDFQIPRYETGGADDLPSAEGHFVVRIGGRNEVGNPIIEEECLVRDGHLEFSYRVKKGKVLRFDLDAYYPPPAVPEDNFYLVNASGFPGFRSAYHYLSRMGFYNLNPAQIRELQSPDAGDFLERDGRNVSSVLARMRRASPEMADRIKDYLEVVVPGVTRLRTRSLGSKETLEFTQLFPPSKEHHFLAENMSDGTLRVTGVLTALFQSVRNGSAGPSYLPLVAIEEPEAALHPAAAGILRDLLREATEYTQVIVTSHSPDLLDDSGIPVESIRSVSATHGETIIAPINPALREILRERLFTIGELLKLNQLNPDPAIGEKARLKPESLFSVPLNGEGAK